MRNRRPAFGHGSIISGTRTGNLHQPWKLTNRRKQDTDLGNVLLESSLDDSDLVCNVERVIVRSEFDVRLLTSIRTDEGIDLGNIDVVQFLDRLLDLRFVRLRRIKDPVNG